MTADKEYSQKYYQDHEDINRRKRKPYETRIKVIRVLGVRIEEKKLKPFMERISPELRAKIEENTKTNNKKIKFYNMIETKDTHLVQNLMKMKETKAEN